jgi:CRP-like cAMP-binding protein
VLELAREEFLALATDADLLGTQLGSVILQRYVRTALKDAIPGVAAAMANVDAIGVVHKTPGEYVFRQGDVADRVYVVTDGYVQVFHERDGGEISYLATLGTGDVFGEIGVLQSHPRTATVRATTDVVLLALERDALEALIKDAPAGREQLATLIGQRLMRIIEALGSSLPLPSAQGGSKIL